jgi:hypothetical protein
MIRLIGIRLKICGVAARYVMIYLWNVNYVQDAGIKNIFLEVNIYRMNQLKRQQGLMNCVLLALIGNGEVTMKKDIPVLSLQISGGMPGNRGI